MAHKGGQGDRRVGQRPKGVGGQVVPGLGHLEIEISHRQLLQLIAAVGGGQEISGQGGVEYNSLRGQPLGQQPLHQRLGVVDHLFDLRREDAPQKVVVALQLVREKEGGFPRSFASPLHADGVQSGRSQHRHVVPLPPQRQQLLHARPVRDLLAFTGAHTLELFLYAPRRSGGQAHFVDELGELQLQKELVQGKAVHRLPGRVLRSKVQRGVAVDGRQVIGHPGLLPALGQFFQHRRLGLYLLQTGVEGLHAVVALDQVHGGLFPDALHPGDVVAGVPHQRLQVDHMDGLEAIGLLKGGGRHLFGGGLSHAGGHQLHPGAAGDELQGVLVPGDDHRVPPRRGVPHRDGADQIVGLPPLQLVAWDVHGVQDLLQDGHLGGQLIGHPLALGLIALIGQMPEGGAPPIEGDAQGVGPLLIHQLLQDGEKAVDGVGGCAVPGGEHPNAVKGPVDDGIAVDDHELHGEASCPRAFAART